MRNATTPIAEKTANHPSRRHGGFTLMEIMIVVVILGVIAAIAYPAYQRYVTEARRSEGQRLLFLAAAQQERVYTQCGWYASNFATPRACGAAAGNGDLGMLNNIPEIPFYTLRIDAGTTGNIATSYLLTATPSGIQLAKDTDCGNLTLSSQGTKGQTGPLGAFCWKR